MEYQMNKLTTLEAAALEALRSNLEYETETPGFYFVNLEYAYAELARTRVCSFATWAGTLSSLERKGLFTMLGTLASGYVKGEPAKVEETASEPEPAFKPRVVVAAASPAPVKRSKR
jgi:hypothetical protein